MKKFVEYQRIAREMSVRSAHWLRFADSCKEAGISFKSRSFRKGQGMVNVITNFLGYANRNLAENEIRVLQLLDAFLYLLEEDKLPAQRDSFLGVAEKYVILRVGASLTHYRDYLKFEEFVMGPLLNYTRARHGVPQSVQSHIHKLLSQYEDAVKNATSKEFEVRSALLERTLYAYLTNSRKAA